MIYDNIDFHNVEELTEVPENKGHRIQRVPEAVRLQLSESGQGMILSPTANVELRFILVSDSVEITLSSKGPSSLKMFVFWSGFQEREFIEINEEPKIIKLEMHERYKKMAPKHCKGTGFSKNLVRLIFTGGPYNNLYYHGINGQVAVPTDADRPAKTLLTYGTSITHGVKLTGPHLTYAYQTAHNLGMDLINLGFAGTAFCEKAIADHIASRTDWDIGILALSVNMYNNEAYTLEQFKERIGYMIETIAKFNPEKPIFCITLYPFFDDVEIYNENSTKNAEDYRQALRDKVLASSYTNVHCVEGSEILTDFTLLAPDLIHPNDMGMIQMGRNLADKIKAIIDLTDTKIKNECSP